MYKELITKEKLKDFKSLNKEIDQYLNLVPGLMKYHFDNPKVGKTTFDNVKLCYEKKVKVNNAILIFRFAMEHGNLFITVGVNASQIKWDIHDNYLGKVFTMWSMNDVENLTIGIKHDYFYIDGPEYSALRHLKVIDLIENAIEEISQMIPV